MKPHRECQPDIVDELRSVRLNAYETLRHQAAEVIEQLRRDLSHAKAGTEVWMNRARKAEAGPQCGVNYATGERENEETDPAYFKPAHSQSGVQIEGAALTWEPEAGPDKSCPYDHTTAATPFGTYRIEWKSWKDYPSHSVEFEGHFVTVENRLADAKEVAQDDFNKRLLAALALPVTEPTAEEIETTMFRIRNKLAMTRDSEAYRMLREEFGSPALSSAEGKRP